MRIVQLLGSSAGGVSQHVAQISRLLADDVSFDVVIASPSNLREKFIGIAQHVPLEIADRPGAGDLANVTRIKAIAGDADVIHAHGLRAGALAGIALKTLPRNKRPKLVVTLHNMPVGSWKIQLMSQVLERLVAFSADAILGVSMDIVERMRSMSRKVRGRALVPAPELGEISRPVEQTRLELLGAQENVNVVFTVARLAPQKGLSTLVEASALLAADGVAHKWFVAGDGPLQADLQAKIDSLNAPVQLLGRRSDIADLLAATDVFVNAALWEGQPVAVQEALRAGKALVVTDVGGTKDVAQTAALYVQESNPEAMKIAVGEVLGSEHLKTVLEGKALARSKELPSEADVLESLRSLYASI